MDGKVLFVCTGNVYRSQVAEYLFNEMFTNIKAASAGLDGLHANKKVRDVWREKDMEDVGKELERLGIRILGNKCKLIKEDDIAGARIVFVMDRKQKAELERRFPKFRDRIKVLGEFANLKDPRIYDLPEEPSPRKTVEKNRKALEIIKKKKLIENRKE